MLKDRLKQIEIRVTELSDYLQISRPTLYAYIDNYDKKKYGQINPKVLGLFNYITENQLAGKKNVINYILNNLVVVEDIVNSDENDIINKVKKCILENPESKKSKFLEVCACEETFDKIVFYLSDVATLLKKKKLTENDERLLKPYQKFIAEIENLKN